MAEKGLLKSMLIMVGTGVLLGVSYNAVGLEQGDQGWGLRWIAEDRGELEDLDDVLGVEPAEDDPLVTDVDDPMALMLGTAGSAPSEPASTADLPEIPDLGRPIQMQLHAVKKFFDANGALIVDAREPEEYRAGHIAGSINLPFDEVITDPVAIERVDSGGRPIIVYCGGGTCELSLNLAWEMIRLGHNRVLVFMGGYPEWTEAGYPIETGAGEAS